MTDEKAARPYHHGDLKAAMLRSAEAILEREGVQGLTLRGAAREAGASHAAPKNHFDDLTGLLSELAAVGFTRFTGKMLAAAAAQSAPQDRLSAIGRAYVEFAVENPGLFQLMFRSERLDTTRPALRQAMDAAAGVLSGSVRAASGGAPSPALTLEQAGRVVSAWSVVHGFSMLLLDGRLAPILAQLPPGADAAALLDQMLGLRRS